MSSNPSAEVQSRLKAVLAAAKQPTSGRRRFVRPGLWRWTAGDIDLALKLFDGPNAHERLRTEEALCRELCRVKAPVPSLIHADSETLALARDWVPGSTLYERLLTAEQLSQAEAKAVRCAWLQLVDALKPWTARIEAPRREAALRKRRLELSAVAQAVADSYPTLPADAIYTLSESAAAGEVALLPLDATPSNIIVSGGRVTFIDLELLGIDFADWTYAKYVTAVDESGTVRSLAASQPDDSVLHRVDASVTLLALARAAGLWDAPPIAPRRLADLLPGRSLAARRIRRSLGLESNATSGSG